MVAVLLCVGSGGAYIASAVVARHRCQAAADLAAVAAAAALPAGAAVACERAAQVIQRLRAEYTGCVIEGLDVVVTAETALAFRPWRADSARAAARAGP